MISDAEIFEVVQAANAKTDAACHGKPVLVNLRNVLLETEQKAHATGWDGPDARARLFIIYRERASNGIGLGWADLWNSLLPHLMRAGNSNLGKSLRAIAEAAEMIRGASRGDFSDLPAWMSHDPLSRPILDDMIRRAQRGEDLHSPQLKGFEVFGYGVRFEAWSAHSAPRDEEGAAELHRASRARTIYQRPDRIETRIIHAVTRDDRSWLLTRYRGFRPFVHLFGQGDDSYVGGGVPNALSRLLAATVASPVTIIPNDRPHGAPYFRR